LVNLTRGTEIKAEDKNYEIIAIELQKNLMNGGVRKDMGLVVKELKMTYQQKVEKYLSKNAMQAFKEKTPFEELPIKFGHGSSTHHPEAPKTGMTTCDIKLWMKFLDNWFTPYGGFSQDQIEQMIEICNSDQQIDSLMSLLSAK
jgi:hypothetical protein